jgi:hypothetical protein
MRLLGPSEGVRDPEGARDLVVAIFRLAVADCLGIAYGFDGARPAKRTHGSRGPDDASDFLTSGWALHLGDLAGFSAAAVDRGVRARSSACSAIRSRGGSART